MLKEVINLQKRQQGRYDELKKIILNKITDKISHLSKHGEMKCIYTVPSYIFGFPKYDVVDITVYLYNILKKEGFCTFAICSDKLFISWDIRDINKINKNIKKKEHNKLFDIKPLINIKK